MVRSVKRSKGTYVNAYGKYIESGSWKCSSSPTGAHYWLVISDGMKCKYCSEERIEGRRGKKS